MMILTLAAVLAPALAGAAEPLTLPQALERARSQNPEIRALRERAGAITARSEATRRGAMPRFGLEVGAQATNNAAAAFASRLNAGEFRAQDFELARLNSPDAIAHLGSSLFVEAPIDLAHRASLAADAQAAGGRAMAAQVREAENTLGLQVTETYHGALLARRALEVTEKALNAARAREAATEARFSEGVALQADVLRVRARRREREADVAARRADLAIAESLLKTLMGAPADAAFVLADSPTTSEAPVDLGAWQERAALARPVIQAASDQQAAASLATRIEKRGAWPEIGAQARLMDDRISGGSGRSWSIGAGLRWTAFDASRSKRLAAAVADEQAAAQDARAARDRVSFEVESEWLRLTAARERVTAAAGGAEEGREALRVVQERRSQGLATLTDELETEAAAFAAELEEIHAARAAVMAEAALKRAAGDIFGSTK